MRLIDGEELKNRLQQIIDDYGESGIYPTGFGIEDAIEMVDEMKTVTGDEFVSSCVNPSGVIRRLDDLHRLCLTKSVCKAIGFKEGDAIEIFSTDGLIVLKKYVPEESEEW